MMNATATGWGKARILKPRTRILVRMSGNKFYCPKVGCQYSTKQFNKMIRHQNSNCRTNA
jgi:hypothetical protein